MTLAEALNIVIARTGHQRFRFLCSEANPDPVSREGYRRAVLTMAGEPAPEPPPPRPDRPIPYAPRPGGCCG